MPLDDEFGPQIHGSNADLCNVRPEFYPICVVCAPRDIETDFGILQTGGKPGGSCTAALFLKPFVEGIEAKDTEGEESNEEDLVRWAHIDIAGVMEATRASPYMETGMTGRPVRALVEFVRRMGQD